MKIVFWILGGLVLLYLNFAVIPTLIAFFCTYKGLSGEDLDRTDEEDLSNSQYVPYMPRIRAGIEWYRRITPEMTTVHTESYDGLKLAGHYYDAGHRKTAIFFHGYHTTIPNNFGVVSQDLLALGFNLLFVDQRGFGESEGKACCFGLKEQYDVLSWCEYTDRELHAEEILVFGVSMGGATVAYSSDKIVNPKVKALIDDCGFTCVHDLQVLTGKRRRVPVWLMMPLVRVFAKLFHGIDITYSTEKALKNAKRPMLFIHGTEDIAVPFSWGQKNIDACGSEKETLIVENAGHAVAYIASGDEGKDKLKQFVIKYFNAE